MIELYFWTTPNGYKPLLFLEEAGVPYTIKPVNISTGEQFEPKFLEISPNNRIPAIVDRDPPTGASPISIFESGAILQYLAEKTGKYLPVDVARHAEVMQWLFWQMGGIGPMFGQYLHFSAYASEKIPYAIERYENETDRLYRVLENRLADHLFVADGYSIADMAIYPWIVRLEREKNRLDGLPGLKRWFDDISARPATIRAYEKGRAINTEPTVTEKSKKFLLGQGARRAA
jgi:GST-like protein